MAGFTSNSKDPIVLKILVDYAWFEKLKEAEKELEKIRESEIKKLQLVQSEPSDQYGAGNMVVDQTDQKTDICVLEKNEQTGEGPSKRAKVKHRQKSKQQQPNQTKRLSHSSSNITEEKIRQIFREEIQRYFSKPPSSLIEQLKNIKVKDVLQHVPYVNQLIGKGNVDSDLIRNGIQSHDNTSMHNNNEGGYYSQLGQSKPIILRENDFLKLIPSKFHARGKKLLDYFENHSMNVSWNSDGNVTVANEFIPNSNIYEIFVELYKFKPNLNLPGYITLASYLLNAGLGDLFVRTHYWFTTRRLKNFKASEDQTGKGQVWYYIGE